MELLKQAVIPVNQTHHEKTSSFFKRQQKTACDVGLTSRQVCKWETTFHQVFCPVTWLTALWKKQQHTQQQQQPQSDLLQLKLFHHTRLLTTSRQTGAKHGRHSLEQWCVEFQSWARKTVFGTYTHTKKKKKKKKKSSGVFLFLINRQLHPFSPSSPLLSIITSSWAFQGCWKPCWRNLVRHHWRYRPLQKAKSNNCWNTWKFSPRSPPPAAQLTVSWVRACVCSCFPAPCPVHRYSSHCMLSVGDLLGSGKPSHQSPFTNVLRVTKRQSTHPACMLSVFCVFVAVEIRRLSVWLLFSVTLQFKMVSMHLGKPTWAPPCLSEDSSLLPLKQFQRLSDCQWSCTSDWQWSFFILSMKIEECTSSF